MIFLSLVSPSLSIHLANLGAVVITTAFVIFGGSLSLHYIFLVTMEVVAMLLIGWYTLMWRPSDRAASDRAVLARA